MTPSRKNAEGKRIDKANPANSLVLRKPSFQEPHGGGQRFKVDRDDYNLILDWLKKGAPYDAPGQARLRSLTVYPPNWRMVGVGHQSSSLPSASTTTAPCAT